MTGLAVDARGSYTGARTMPEAANKCGREPGGCSAAATVLFAGGGTGGHISPGLAVAEALRELRPDVGRLFVCSNREIDRTMLAEAGEPFIPLGAMPFGRRPAQLLRFIRGWQSAVKQACGIIRSRQVGVVIALGGFVAAPAVAAARRCGVPTILLNLDAVPGKANRYIARRGAEVLTACDLASEVRGFDASPIGMPLRRSTLASTFGDVHQCRRTLGLDPVKPTLLITGASQGSQSINDLIRGIVEHHASWLTGWQVHHLAGHGREGLLADQFVAAGIPALVEPFRAHMGLAWGAADLVISRAGANSVAEIAANAVPSILLPYPHHRDSHQFHNAMPLVEAGGAVVCEDFVDPVRNLREHGEVIARLIRDASARQTMRSALEARRPRNGAEAVAARLVARLKLPPRTMAAVSNRAG